MVYGVWCVVCGVMSVVCGVRFKVCSDRCETCDNMLIPKFVKMADLKNDRKN